jgi:hypothetical protein
MHTGCRTSDPTYLNLEINEEKVLYYATLFTSCRDADVQDGINDIKADRKKIAPGAGGCS